ncbi:uncharacterized protein SPSK_02064 [Sporothrix schenckii 1099-18]|uniref:Uncharacterized protein n=1 Tax=Sporothrix schenckii 1099-18 TaxID=1397361 RepID=A0A0F2MEL0_SPOSC|nr:uncharacterized protein SPSK_02064 [Sporothrix schenckii 1099-18]KJR87509.1 hypothetical protein SPSK_02064 [Sporothrix schenckii 1099-18]
MQWQPTPSALVSTFVGLDCYALFHSNPALYWFGVNFMGTFRHTSGKLRNPRRSRHRLTSRPQQQAVPDAGPSCSTSSYFDGQP